MIIKKLLYAISLILFAVSVSADQTTAPLLDSNDLTYLGSFKLAAAFNYGGSSLAVSADGLSLYASAKGDLMDDPLKKIGKVTIPTDLSGSVTATTTMSPVAVSLDVGGTGSQTKLASSLVYNNKLISSVVVPFDSEGWEGNSHQALDLNVANATGYTRFYNVQYKQFVNGYMGLIPSEWQAALGGPAFAGNSYMSIDAQCSNGPSFYVFDPDDVTGSGTIPNTPLMLFPYANPISTDYVVKADVEHSGMVFPSGTRSVLYLYMHGTGDYCYGSGAACGDTCFTSQGVHQYPYQMQVLAFDANDLLAVKNGTKNYYNVVPYATWELEELNSSTCPRPVVYGMAYDPVNRRIYLGKYGDTIYVHVYEVAGGDETPEVLPTTTGATLTGVSQITAN